MVIGAVLAGAQTHRYTVWRYLGDHESMHQIRSLCAPAATWPVYRPATPSRRWDADGA
jgi:hypothetical protein